MKNCVIWSPDCIAGFACPGPVTNSPWRAAPRCGVLFSGPAHAEFHFCSLKVPPPKSPSGRPRPRGVGAHTGGGKPSGGLRDLPHSEQKGFQPFIPIFGVFVNELSNHCFQRTIKSFHRWWVRWWVIDAGANRLNSQQFIKFANGSCVMNLVTTHSTAHHPWTTSPIMHCTHTFPSTITPITQLSPFTHQP